jgi:hypothetical protein
MISGLFLLLIFGLIGLAITQVVRSGSGPKSDAAAGAARRVVVFGLLFGLVTVTAVGLAGLAGRLLEGGEQLAGTDVAGLAQSLAFTLIAGPIAVVLWWYLWKGIDDAEERASIGWSLYIAGMSTVSLIVATTTLLSAATAGISGRWESETLATGLVWSLVWGWHRWMRTHPAKGPTHLDDLATVIGSYFGLIVMLAGAAALLGSLLQEAFDSLTGASGFGEPWWEFALEAMVWAVGGALVWWWHWARDGGRGLETDLADVALVTVGTTAPGVVALGGLGTIVFTLLTLLANREDTVAVILEPLPASITAVAIGGAAWAYHRSLGHRRSPTVREASRLIASGVGLVVAATGVGVIVNSILDSFTADLAGAGGGRSLLLGGLSALIVGGPLWWIAWQPTGQHRDPVTTGRRVYLVAVFGVSAVVAVITLLVIGFRLFEFMLEEVGGGSLVDRIRAPFGLLVATGLVAGYHYPVWKRDREAQPEPTHKRVGHMILVTGSDPAPLRHIIDEKTGAAVTVWMRADVDGPGPSPEHFADALDGVEGKRVMVVTGPGAQVQVITLQD